MSKRGVLTNGYGIKKSIAMSAGWYDWKALTISGESTDVTVLTKYSGLALNGIMNNTANLATVIVKTSATPGTALTLYIPAYSAMYPVPEIATIVKSGSSDGLVLMFLKR
jgi:arginine/ornithine N-succinyltransferase beta subunit